MHPAIYNAVRKLTGMALTRGNDVELLIDGEATFVRLLKGIAQARDYILFQFYIMRDDELGRRVKQALIDRAEPVCVCTCFTTRSAAAVCRRPTSTSCARPAWK